MTTSANFYSANAKFLDAADRVGDLTAAAEQAYTADVLRGGALGQHVPKTIAESAALARRCQRILEAAAHTCVERAELLAAYEVEYEIFLDERQKYDDAWAHWDYMLSTGVEIVQPDVLYPYEPVKPEWVEGVWLAPAGAGSPS